MSTVRCLCCEQVNPLGAKFCAACGSTLNLKLCKQCEAVNESSAQRCHNCGTEFSALATADELGGWDAAVSTDLRMLNTPSAARLPLQTFSSPGNRSAPWRVRSSRAVLSALLLAVIAGFVYYRYGELSFRSASREANPGGTPTVAVTSGTGTTLTTESATSPAGSPAKQSVTHTGRIAPAPAAASTADTTTPPLRGTPSEELRSSRVAAAATAETGAAEAAKAAPASELLVNPAKQRVTHTVGVATTPVATDFKETPAVSRATAEASAAVAVPISSTDTPAAVAPPPPACTETVAALGLCSPSAKGREDR